MRRIAAIAAAGDAEVRTITFALVKTRDCGIVR